MTNHLLICTSCLSEIPQKTIYIRKKCPAVNNVTFDSVDQARACATGTVALIKCPECCFIFNCLFDNELVPYDRSYNTSRSHSRVYYKYLDQLVDSCSTWLNRSNVVLEIGCGNGDFLKRLSDATGCYGYGYDTSYQGENCYGARVTFYKKYFQPGSTKKIYDTLIIRHVLEHIAAPHAFLLGLLKPKIFNHGVRILIEVPDIAWIIKNRTFYDITYEHCNYFSRESLFSLVTRIGWEVEKINNVYGDQYLLLQGKYTGNLPRFKEMRYAETIGDFSNGFNATKQWLFGEIRKAEVVCVWGASGKGVIFLSELPDVLLGKIAFVIDIDPAKQGRFLPVTGKRVYPPKILRDFKGKLLVLVMNEIYKEEVSAELCRLGVDASILCCIH